MTSWVGNFWRGRGVLISLWSLALVILFQNCGDSLTMNSLSSSGGSLCVGSDCQQLPPPPDDASGNGLLVKDQENSWKNFFAVCWQDAPATHIKYAKQMGYDYIGIPGQASPDGYKWISERAGLKFYLVSPHWNKLLFQGYKPIIPLSRVYTPEEKSFFEKYMAWKSTDPFPNNLATGWFDGNDPNLPYAMLDFQQQAVIDYAVEKILTAAKGYEDTSIGFNFAGVMFDVPRLKGDFHINGLRPEFGGNLRGIASSTNFGL